MTPRGTHTSSSGARVLLSIVAGIIAVVSGTAAAVGVWAQAVLLDVDGSERHITQIVDSPSVTKGVGERLGDQLVRLYDENISFADRVPSALKDEAEALDLTITDEIRERSLSVSSSTSVRAAVVGAAVEAHRAAVEALTADDSADARTVRLNLVPAATALFKSLQETGAWPETPVIPDIDETLAPEAQIAALESALGFELPDELSSVEIFGDGTDQRGLDDARGWVKSLKILTWVTCFVFGVMLLVAVVARRSARGRVWTGAGLASVTAASVLIVSRQAPSRISSATDDPTWSSALSDIVEALVSPLSTWAIVLAIAAATATAGLEVMGLRRRRSIRRSTGDH